MSERVMRVTLSVAKTSPALRHFYREVRKMGLDRRDVNLICFGVATARSDHGRPQVGPGKPKPPEEDR